VVPRGIRTDAFVLRSVDYGDSDRIVTLLTSAEGRVAALARGARKSQKRFAGALQPFCRLEVELVRGRGELHRLAEARVTRAFPSLLSSLARMTAAGAALEVLRALAPEHHPEPALFEATERFFERLAVSEPGLERLEALRAEARFVGVAGFAPNLQRCGRCGREAPRGRAALFDPAAGSVICRACGGAPLKLTGEARAWLDDAAAGGAAPLDPSAAPMVERALEAFLLRQLSRPLEGTRMLRAVAALGSEETG
jgi:DNA repair protein RecO (recombination protein O)